MKTLALLLFTSFALLLPAWTQVRLPTSQEKYVAYAQFIEDTMVELTDGSQWKMDKGDCFPIHMFKEEHTRVILQLGSATFTTDAKRVRVLKDSEADEGLRSYRVTLEGFLRSRADQWKKQAESGAKPKS